MADNHNLQEKLLNKETENLELKKKISMLENMLAEKIVEIRELVSEKNRLLADVAKTKEFSKIEVNEIVSAMNLKELKLQEKIKELEDEAKVSSRLNFSCSFDSESSYYQQGLELSDIGFSKPINNGELFVSKVVGDYIQSLLAKISALASKSRKLRLQRDNLKYRIETDKKKNNLY